MSSIKTIVVNNETYDIEDAGARTLLSDVYNKEEANTLLNEKVPKESGKSLVLDTEIARLANVDNYDDTAIKTRISTLESFTEQDPTVPNHVKNITSQNITNWNGKAEISDIPNVPAWALQDDKPTYTASEVGLGNVDNTSDLNKPVSTAQQSAIDDAYANSNAYTDQKIADLINGAPSTLDTLGEVAEAMKEHEDVVSALNDAIGTKANQSELDTHTENSTIHITSTERNNWNAAKTHAESAHAPSNAQENVIETVKVNGTAVTPNSKAVNIVVPTKVSDLVNDSGFKITDNNTTYSLSKSGSTITLTGSDGSTTSVTDDNTTYSTATTSDDGLMSSTDKSKLDGIESGAQKNTVTGIKGNSESSYRTGNINITPANIGLGNVGNYKAVSTLANQGLSDTEKSNARTNIGAGTSSFSGSYNDLSNKPSIPTKLSELTNDVGFKTTTEVFSSTQPTSQNNGDVWTKLL